MDEKLREALLNIQDEQVKIESRIVALKQELIKNIFTEFWSLTIKGGGGDLRRLEKEVARLLLDGLLDLKDMEDLLRMSADYIVNFKSVVCSIREQSLK